MRRFLLRRDEDVSKTSGIGYVAEGLEFWDGTCCMHIDGDKLNNSLSNLILCDNARSHRNLHASLELVAFELVRRGVIGFDRENRRYFLAE